MCVCVCIELYNCAIYTAFKLSTHATIESMIFYQFNVTWGQSLNNQFENERNFVEVTRIQLD